MESVYQRFNTEKLNLFEHKIGLAEYYPDLIILVSLSPFSMYYLRYGKAPL